MTLLDRVGTAPTVRRGLAMVKLANGQWRVTRATGEVLGYIEAVVEGRELKFSSRRLIPNQRGSLPLGDFWRMDDAIDCFRL
ncbi:hypothetical protein B0I08_101194 [Glaciihabitans tibetensis]|uniref:Uncharacterized protein n=1 Tax=Glaciihabitans tibetensis TaxID=1266600 RepID=A0A2T0VIL6_9MICO|nr:hypothetical protein [Glaciihabitans tibetensis]PRY70069.1 hypothetical protein B0I08_101194 [Glaciihabitans tibetensis]